MIYGSTIKKKVFTTYTHTQNAILRTVRGWVSLKKRRNRPRPPLPLLPVHFPVDGVVKALWLLQTEQQQVADKKLTGA